MVLDTNQLLFENRHYKDPHHKIRSMVQKGELIPLKRGLYETDCTANGCVLAFELTGPSYLSFEYALARYGMIPERVNTYTSAVFGRGKRLRFENAFGVFTYRDVPERAFPYYYTRESLSGRYFFIAAREKALCDQLSTLPPIRGLRDFEEYLFDGMRLDEDAFAALDFEKLRRLAPLYRKTNLDQLAKLTQKGRYAR